jgi:hypothetical protein
VYPDLGPPQACRVLGSRAPNDAPLFLVAFFQPAQSPCFVPGDYVFPLGDDDHDEQFDAQFRGTPVSVDWLLERIFSTAQRVAVGFADLLAPAAGRMRTEVLMAHSAACAALLVLAYIASRWRIPAEKLVKILETIIKTDTCAFASTKAIMAGIEERLKALLLHG